MEQSKFNSWIVQYAVVMTVSILFAIIVRKTFYSFIFNHFFAMFFMAIEQHRFKKYLKMIRFNVYSYRVSGWDYNKRLANIVKNEVLEDWTKVELVKYLRAFKIWYAVAGINFFSIFVLYRFHTI